VDEHIDSFAIANVIIEYETSVRYVDEQSAVVRSQCDISLYAYIIAAIMSRMRDLVGKYFLQGVEK